MVGYSANNTPIVKNEITVAGYPKDTPTRIEGVEVVGYGITKPNKVKEVTVIGYPTKEGVKKVNQQ